MRKLFLVAFIAALFTGVSANAQGLKGVWFAGGNISIGSEKEYNDAGSKIKTTDFTVLPLVGKFISPSVAIGGALGYSQNKVEDVKNQTFIIQPLVRQYWNISGKLFAFGQVALPVSFGNIKNDGTKISDQFNMGLAFAPGLDLIVNNWLTIEASFNLLSIGYSTDKPKGGSKSSDFKFNGNFLESTSLGKVNIGVKILF